MDSETFSEPPEDRGLDKRVSAESRAVARDLGLTITLSEGRGSALARARESIERALQGDNRLLDERLSAGCASPDEQRLIAALRARRVKPRKRRLDELVAEDRRQLVAEFVKVRTKPGVKRESIIRDAEMEFGIPTSEVYASLKKARE